MAPAKKETASKSMPKAGKDPKGGLTATGRAFFKETQGSNLRPGVRGAADTPEKMLRKGSFLRRHYAHPRGPVVDEKGQPTRQALQAAAWGEPVPKTTADERKLAQTGKELLTKYHIAKGDAKSPRGSGAKAASTPAGAGAAKKAATKKAAGKAAPKKAAATSAGAGKSAKKGTAGRKRPATKRQSSGSGPGRAAAAKRPGRSSRTTR